MIIYKAPITHSDSRKRTIQNISTDAAEDLFSLPPPPCLLYTSPSP